MYHKDKLYPQLNYFIRKKSEYILDFCLIEINNIPILSLVISHNQKFLNNIFICLGGI